MADKKITSDQILDQYIPQYESMGGQNIPNYMYDEGHTAQGPYQLTVTNWNNYGPGVGIDLNQYPTPMDAPRPEQRKVAEYLLNYTPQGVRNWTDFNPKLKAALDKAGYEMPQDQEQDQDIDYSKKSPEELMKIIKARHPDMVIEPPKPAAQATTKKLDVKPPEAGWHKSMREWAESPPATGFRGFMQGGMIYPGMKQIARGFLEDEDTPSRISDFMEGAGGVAEPFAIGASLPEMLSLGGLERLATSVGAGYIANKVAPDVAKGAGVGPSGQRLTGDVASLIAGLAGYRYPRQTQGAAIGLGGAALGHPAIGTELGLLRAGLPSKLGITGRLGKFGRALDLFAGEKPMPTDAVASPGKPLPKTPMEDDMLKTQSLTPDQYVKRMKDMGMADDVAKAKLHNAQQNHIKEAAEAAKKNQPKQEASSPVTLQPSQMTTSGTPPVQNLQVGNVPVNVPSQVTAVPNAGPAPSGTPTPPPLTGGPQLPVEAPPAEQPQGLSGFTPQQPLPKIPLPPGGAAANTPITPPLNMPPAAEATPQFGAVADPRVAPQVPNAPPSDIVKRGMPPAGMTPVTPDLPTIEQVGKAIADKAKEPPPKAKSKLIRRKAAEKMGLDFTPTAEEFAMARRIYDNRQRAKLPTTSMPS